MMVFLTLMLIIIIHTKIILIDSIIYIRYLIIIINYLKKYHSITKFQIDMYLVNNEWDSDSIDLFDYNTIRFAYNDEVNSLIMLINKRSITTNENNISSNSDKIKNNETSISSNLSNINTNKDNISANLAKINDIVNNSSSIKNIYNILFYDSKTQVDFRNLFYEKIFEVNTKQNDFIEMNLKMLLEYENMTKKIILILFMKFLMKIIIHYIFLQ